MRNICMTLVVTFLFLLLGCGNTKSAVNITQQAKSFDRWITVKMNDEIEFQIPPNLEIQEDRYKNIVKKVDPNGYNTLHAPGRKRMVVQQKGLNDLSKEALSHYVRAVMEIFEYNDEFPAFGEPLNTTKKDAEEFGNLIAREGQEFSVNIGGKTQVMRVVAITTPARVMRINGVECIFMSYDSKFDNKPIVKNDVYCFFNKRKMYRLMTMIRSTEYNLWTSGNTDIRNIVQTIKLIK